MLFSASTISILKEDRDVLRVGVSNSINLSTILEDKDEGNMLIKGPTVNLSYVFKKHYLLSGYINIDNKSKGISFSYYEVFNNLFVSANFGLGTFPGAIEYFSNGFYSTAVIGLGVSKPLTDNLDLLARYSYGGVINSDNTVFSGGVGTYLYIKLPPKKDVNLYIGASQSLRSENFNPGFGVGIRYNFDI